MKCVMVVVLTTMALLYECFSLGEEKCFCRNRKELDEVMRRAYWNKNTTTWMPEVEMMNKSIGLEWSAIEKELWRSIRAVRPHVDNLEEAQHILEYILQQNQSFVLLFKRRVIVHNSFLKVSKHREHLRLVRSALLTALKAEKDTRWLNAIYLVDTAVTGTDLCAVRTDDAIEEKLRPPILLNNKKYGYRQCGILYISSFFSIGNNHNPALDEWEKYINELSAISSRYPWKERDPRAFWRGTMFAPAERSCNADWGNYARLEAIARGIDAPQYIDAGCAFLHRDTLNWNRSCSARPTDGSNPCLYKPEPPPYDSTMAAIADRRLNPQRYLKPFLSQANFSKYKFLLSLPGAAAGSYSRNLDILWSSGAIILLWDAPYTEWYFPALKNGHTHLAVNNATLVDTVKNLEELSISESYTFLSRYPNTNIIDKLLNGARQVHEKFLCPSCLARYTKMLLVAIRYHYSMAPILDDVEQAYPFLSRNLRSRCNELIEVFYDGPIKERPLVQDDPICVGAEEGVFMQ